MPMAWYDNAKSKSAVREYRTQREMERDIEKATANGWMVVSTSEMGQRSGCLRMLSIGIFALVWKPKSHFLVTYSRS